MMGHTAVTSSDLPLVGARTMARKQLTKALIERTKPPASGRVEILDSVIPQLALRVSSTGAKSFVLRTRVDGKQFRYSREKRCVYSIGSDAKDEGGFEQDDDNLVPWEPTYYLDAPEE